MDYSAILRKIEYLLGTLLALVVADGIISQFLIEKGLGKEGNPLLKPLATSNDLLIIKMCGAILCVLILWNIAKSSPKLILVVSSFFVAVYTAILFWNIAAFMVSII